MIHKDMPVPKYYVCSVCGKNDVPLLRKMNSEELRLFCHKCTVREGVDMPWLLAIPDDPEGLRYLRHDTNGATFNEDFQRRWREGVDWFNALSARRVLQTTPS